MVDINTPPQKSVQVIGEELKYVPGEAKASPEMRDAGIGVRRTT